jgi:hypothetical protein
MILEHLGDNFTKKVRDPGYEIRKKPSQIQGSRGKKATNLGSATLVTNKKY